MVIIHTDQLFKKLISLWLLKLVDYIEIYFIIYNIHQMNVASTCVKLVIFIVIYKNITNIEIFTKTNKAFSLVI